MITEIGIAAGEIWHYLDKHNKTATLEEINKNLDRNKDIIFMSIGWLAREGHIIIEGSGPKCIITLRK